MAVDLVGIQTVDHLNRIFHLNNHDFSLSSNFKQAVSALKRTGHARFRRGPASVCSEDKVLKDLGSGESIPGVPVNKECYVNRSGVDTSVTVSVSVQSTSSFAEGSVSNGRQFSSLGIVAPSLSFSSRKPPLPSTHRKRHGDERMSGLLRGSGREERSVSRGACHCCKRRKTGSKREVRRIPIIGSKVESIPGDDYSWKKYGEKKVNGSPFPRVYYKCNSVKGCPARKSVELAPTDSKMLLVTYDREHRHTPASLPASLNGLQIRSN